MRPEAWLNKTKPGSVMHWSVLEKRLQVQLSGPARGVVGEAEKRGHGQVLGKQVGGGEGKQDHRSLKGRGRSQSGPQCRPS